MIASLFCVLSLVTAITAFRSHMPDSSVILPFSYTINLDLEMPHPLVSELKDTDFTFNATLSGIFMPMESTNILRLNSSKLNILEVEVVGMKSKYTVRPEKNDIVITTEKKMNQMSSYIVNIKYTGKLNNDGKGFYYSSYMDKEGQTHYFAATDFNPNLAHTFVPCFDAPEETAVWGLTINHSLFYSTVFNSKPKEENYFGLTKQTIFSWAQSMSPQRLAIFISEFENIGDYTDEMVDLHVSGTALILKQCGKEIETKTKKLLKDMTHRLGTRFPLFKLDMIFIPELKKSESNFGVITLAKGAKDTCPTGLGKLLAEQWFGNQFVPNNWTQSIMSEPFSQIVGGIIEGDEAALWNGFELHEAFLTERNGFTLTEDPGVKRMDVLRSNEKKLKKGILIFEMIRRVFGDEAFMDAVHNYAFLEGKHPVTWKNFAYELHLVKPSNITFDVTTFLRPYFMQPGIPLLDVTVDNDTFIIAIKYVPNTDGPILSKSPEDMMVPFSVVKDIKTGETIRKMGKVGEVFRFKRNENVIFFNPDGREYYLVHYSEELYQMVINQMAQKPHWATQQFLRALRVSMLFAHKIDNAGVTSTTPQDIKNV